MKVVLFNSNNVIHSLWAAALSTSGVKTICYISGDIPKDEYLIRFGEVHSFDDSVPEFTKIDTTKILEILEEENVPKEVISFVKRYQENIGQVLMGAGMYEKKAYDIFVSFFMRPNFSVLSVNEEIKNSLVIQEYMLTLAKNTVGVTLGEFTLYRVSDYIHYRLEKDVKEKKKVCIYIDTKDEFLLYSYNGIPPEFSGLESQDGEDNIINSPVKVCRIPMTFWAKVFREQ